MIKGIDVSEHQTRRGAIDWQAVKASGRDFVMIRAGWTGYEGGIDIDDYFHVNMQGAIAAGMDVGVYLYSYNRTPAAAQVGAKQLVKLIAPYKVTYPIAYDVEETAIDCLTGQGKAGLTATVKAFLEAIEAAGYYAQLYTYTGFAAAYLDMSRLTSHDLWLADYRTPNADKALYTGPYGMWQYTVLGTEGAKGKHYWTYGQQPGVQGNCDQNYAYRDYAAIIRQAGLNHLEPAGQPEDCPGCAARDKEIAALKTKIAAAQRALAEKE